MSKILKNIDCRSDLIGGAATQTFAPGAKHPLAATALYHSDKQPTFVLYSLNARSRQGAGLRDSGLGIALEDHRLGFESLALTHFFDISHL